MNQTITAKSTCVTDLTTAQIKELLQFLGEPVYRAKQLQEWLYQKLASSFDEMTNLPRSFREKLAEKANLHSLAVAHEVYDPDGTVKTLFTLADGKTIESALMPYPGSEGHARYTVCASTQVGCPVRCAFCATGQQGFERNLTPGEIIDQVLYYARRLRPTEDSVSNVVFMGMGEPMANYDNLWQAIEMLNAPEGFGLGARHMTISTSGIIPMIERLSKEKLQVGLAISLHAPDDSLRDQLVPINKKYPLKELIQAVRDYFTATGRRPSFEYTLFEGINDSLPQARALVHLVQGMNCHVNLIPANSTPDSRFRPPTPEAALAFENELKRLHLNYTVRVRRGLQINAGCGQLRSRLLDNRR
ncbi:MAG: 23S rRNA (adenine(2503)-C(2))-methyltransferase RlmN [Dehalococcoidales bacterium]|nr:23S rRNA (adenine(2503)-C(2))-methyltransferase RlmN [Dehalococcoidales bacterium]